MPLPVSFYDKNVLNNKVLIYYTHLYGKKQIINAEKGKKIPKYTKMTNEKKQDILLNRQNKQNKYTQNVKSVKNRHKI